MDCVFCQIVSGKVPAAIVWEGPGACAFLDNRPLFPGHCLLIPKEHFETLSDLPPSGIEPLFAAAQMLSRAVESAFAAEGSFVAINNRVSQSVPHLHIHVVPRRKKDGLKGFFWPRTKYATEEAMLDAQQKIRAAIEAMAAARA
ncbi:MAG: HIT family protein [Acidobacteriaceae bacterium]|nr:HIT family protein [Acidobacteriaceae bacterium]